MGRNLLVMLALSIGATKGWAAQPVNILFYGNSFTLQGGTGGVPKLVQNVAVAAGQARPNTENAAVSGMTLSWHIQNSLGVISNPTNFSEAAGFQWDYVVLQEYSTKPTDIAGVGNPTGFKADAQTLYRDVKSHSPGVTPVLWETWSRSPNNTTDLGNYYPGATTYTAKAAQMQGELRRYYGEAQSQIGSGTARFSPVGDAFEASGWDNSLYNPDWYHESNKGALLAALVLYETLYQDSVADLSYQSMGQQLTLSNYGIQNASDWNTMTVLAASVVPEPASLGLLGAGGLLLLRRREIAAVTADEE